MLLYSSPPTTPGVPASPTSPPPPAYIHSYHADILQADTKDLQRRSGTAATDILDAHPLWTSMAISTAIHIDKKSFLSTELPTLASANPPAIHDWYCKLSQQATSTQIDLCPQRQFQKGHALWPQNLPTPTVFEMGSLLLLKLQSKTALDLSNEVLQLLYLEHITHSDSKLAGFFFLHALLAHAADTTTSVLVPLPHYVDSKDPVCFASACLAYRQAEFSKAHEYTARELSLHFLWELDLHSVPIQVQLKAVEDLAPDADVPKSLLVSNLALVLAQSFLPHNPSPPRPMALRLHTPSSCSPSDRSRSISSTPGCLSSGPTLPASTTPHPFRQCEEVQCEACGTWGHSATCCSSLARTCLLQRYIAAHPTRADCAATSWQELHSTSHRRAVARHLQHLHPDVPFEDFPLADLDLDEVYEADFL